MHGQQDIKKKVEPLFLPLCKHRAVSWRNSFDFQKKQGLFFAAVLVPSLKFAQSRAQRTGVETGV